MFVAGTGIGKAKAADVAETTFLSLSLKAHSIKDLWEAHDEFAEEGAAALAEKKRRESEELAHKRAAEKKKRREEEGGGEAEDEEDAADEVAEIELIAAASPQFRTFTQLVLFALGDKVLAPHHALLEVQLRRYRDDEEVRLETRGAPERARGNERVAQGGASEASART